MRLWTWGSRHTPKSGNPRAASQRERPFFDPGNRWDLQLRWVEPFGPCLLRCAATAFRKCPGRHLPLPCRWVYQDGQHVLAAQRLMKCLSVGNFQRPSLLREVNDVDSCPTDRRPEFGLVGSDCVQASGEMLTKRCPDRRVVKDALDALCSIANCIE